MMEEGRWMRDEGRWKMDDGRWEWMEDGRGMRGGRNSEIILENY